eukprot:14353216-Alexandrium_andersonii.AAC.1
MAAARPPSSALAAEASRCLARRKLRWRALLSACLGPCRRGCGGLQGPRAFRKRSKGKPDRAPRRGSLGVRCPFRVCFEQLPEHCGRLRVQGHRAPRHHEAPLRHVVERVYLVL